MRHLLQNPRGSKTRPAAWLVFFLDQSIRAVAGGFESTLLDQLLPDFGWKLLGRRDGHDAGALAGAGRPVVQVGFGVKAYELQALLECLEGSFEFVFVGR